MSSQHVSDLKPAETIHAGHLIGSLDSTGTTFYLTDALGSILTSFNNVSSSASVKGEQDFGPYGTSRYSQGTINTAKGFTGQYNDSLTGLDYYNARYYDPVVGVFLSADVKQSNLQGMNPYGYVGGNPETRSDPTGNRPIPLCYFNNCSAGSPTPQPTNTCTFQECTVVVHNTTYSIKDLIDPGFRRDFLRDFYRQFAPGYDTAELGFFDYLNSSHRLSKQGGYWDSVDDQLAIDEFLAAFDLLNHHEAQNTIVSSWLAFLAHPSNDSWWVAHNGSINGADQNARASGLYTKESSIEQHFINETIHVINTIQTISQGNDNPLNGLFSPKGSTTSILAQIYYPHGYTDQSDLAAFATQAGAVWGLQTFGGVGAIAGFIVFGLVLG